MDFDKKQWQKSRLKRYKEDLINHITTYYNNNKYKKGKNNKIFFLLLLPKERKGT